MEPTDVQIPTSSAPSPNAATAANGFAAHHDGAPGSTEVAAAGRKSVPPDARTAAEIDRVSAIWRFRYAIVASTLVVGAVVYLLTGASAAVYSSPATVSVTAASTPGGSAQDVALASNSLAAQDALLVTSDTVVTAAARHLGISSSALSSHLSSGTLNSQNLIQITAQGPTKDDALRWVQAATTAFKTYLAERASSTSRSLRDSIAAHTESLNQEIALLQLAIARTENAPNSSTSLTNLQGFENQLTQVMGTRATLTANTALAIASQQPVITVIVSGSGPSKVSPRPTLYATVAALLTLLVACQLAIFVTRRRASRAEPL
jgi:capsular polysaccharide biosynthesis protein